MLLFIAATLFTQVTMLNMLIAIMGDTFDKVTENRDIEATRTKIQFIAQFAYALRDGQNKKKMERGAFEEATSLNRLWFVALARAWYHSALENLFKSSSNYQESDYKFFFQISLDELDDQESTDLWQGQVKAIEKRTHNLITSS